MQFGVATARRGWLEKQNVINTYPLKEIEKMLT
jgi:DNA polymerase (family 10)